MGEIQRHTVQGMALPPGVTIHSAPRCGDADRARADARINDAYARGFIPMEEAESRKDAVRQAVLASDLRMLLSDLPEVSRFSGTSIPVKKETDDGWKEWFQERQPLSGMASIVGSAFLGLMPTLLLASLHAAHVLVVVVGVTAIPVAVVAFIASIASIVTYYG